MAALQTAGDESDSDFGYDFTPEDEQLLLQLSSNAAHVSALPSATSVTGVIDTVPGRTEIITSRSATDSNHKNVATIVHRDDNVPSILPPEVQPRSIASPLALSEDVAYPDCMWPNRLSLSEAD